MMTLTSLLLKFRLALHTRHKMTLLSPTQRFVELIDFFRAKETFLTCLLLHFFFYNLHFPLMLDLSPKC